MISARIAIKISTKKIRKLGQENFSKFSYREENLPVAFEPQVTLNDRLGRVFKHEFTRIM